MRFCPRLWLLSALCIGLSGCCLLFPDYPECADTTTSFTFSFTDNRTTFCVEQFQAQWQVNYTDADGHAQSYSSQGTDEQEFVNVPAKNNYLDTGVIIYVNTTCHSDASQDQWSIISIGKELIPAEGTLSMPLDDQDMLTWETQSRSTSIAQQTASAVTKVTGANVSGPSSGKKPNAPARKKSCCN